MIFNRKKNFHSSLEGKFPITKTLARTFHSRVLPPFMQLDNEKSSYLFIFMTDETFGGGGGTTKIQHLASSEHHEVRLALTQNKKCQIGIVVSV